MGLIKREPTTEDLECLWEAAVEFIEDNKIYFDEFACSKQVDKNSPSFILEVCEIVGYAEREDEDEDD